MQQKKGAPSLKWSRAHTVLKFDKSKMVVIYMNQVNQGNNFAPKKCIFPPI